VHVETAFEGGLKVFIITLPCYDLEVGAVEIAVEESVPKSGDGSF